MVSKPIAIQPTTENTLLFNGAKLSFLVNGEDTDGEYAVLLGETLRGLEPPPHMHTNEDEDFFLIEGEVTFIVGDQVIHATPGTYIHAPRGVKHGFSLKTDKAKALLFIRPAGLENLFRALSVPVPEDYPTVIRPPSPDEMQQMLSAYAEYGLKFEV